MEDNRLGKSPIIWSTSSSDLSELAIGIEHVIEQGCQGVLLLTCIDNGYDLSQTNTLMSQCSKPICGGMFPEIVLQTKHYRQGAIIVGLMFKPNIANYDQLTNDHAKLEQSIKQNSKQLEKYQDFIIIGDAFFSGNELFINLFYDHIGSGITVIGGGAGSLDFIQRPCIYTNQGLISNAMQVIAIPYSISCEVSHGWEILDDPYLVTESAGHCIKALNYMPAFDVYREAIFSATGKVIHQDNFFDIAKKHPLGISGIGDEILVRDPIKLQLKSIVCVGNIPVNSMVYLLHGKADKMILSAGNAAKNLNANTKQKTMLLFDCISRGLFLGADFQHELSAIHEQSCNASLFGVLSLGEIANSKNGAIRLLNKSTVIASL